MDGIALLGEARAAGLVVETDGDRLRIRGPSSAGDVARRLLDHKADVLRALDAAPDALAAHVAKHGAYPAGGIGAPTPSETATALAQAGEVPTWEDLDPPDGWRCPRCSGLLWWEDCGSLERAPVRRCVVCDAEGLDRSDRLAERAAKLRAAAKK
jgi:hypothetical protein